MRDRSLLAKGGLNTKLHSVTDAMGRPLRFFMTAGQVSDYTGALALLRSLPAAKTIFVWKLQAMKRMIQLQADRYLLAGLAFVAM